jgi:hypothetical protein
MGQPNSPVSPLPSRSPSGRPILGRPSLGSVGLALAAAAALTVACQKGGSGLSGDGTEGTTAGPTTADGGSDDGLVLECMPGQVRCAGQEFLETCAPTGLEWLSDACPNNYTCVPCLPDQSCTVDRCAGPCEADTLVPSSAGCSFIANRQLHLQEDFPDSVIVANPNVSLDAEVKFWRTPEGKRTEELVEEVTLAPGEDHLFLMEQDFVLGDSSMFRTGGNYRVESAVPVTAYQHAPAGNHDGTESSLLLPESVAGKSYVAISYSPHAEATLNRGRPSYFEIVALEDYTTVTWTPPVPTAGNGLPIKSVAAGETGSQKMNRFDTMRITASQNFPDEVCDDLQDVSGTVITSDKPIWVVGGSRCSRVPVRGYVREGDDNDTGCDWDDAPRRGFCDPLQEVLIPLQYWGETYIAPPPPVRAPAAMINDPVRNHWRLFAGSSEPVTITSTPPVFNDVNCPAPDNIVSMDGSSCTLPQRGAWVEVMVDYDVGIKFEGDNAFMPVGYLQSRWKRCDYSGDPDYDDPDFCVDEPVEWSTEIGDPAMYQLVPTEQFLDRYVLRTAQGYPNHYVQITRPAGGADVFIDAAQVQAGLFQPFADFEVATVALTEGTHTLESAVPFGVLQMGNSGSQGHFPGCDYTGPPTCDLDCDLPTDQVTCEAFGTSNCSCIWQDGTCVRRRLCASAYAYPGGMKSEQIYIP